MPILRTLNEISICNCHYLSIDAIKDAYISFYSNNEKTTCILHNICMIISHMNNISYDSNTDIFIIHTMTGVRTLKTSVRLVNNLIRLPNKMKQIKHMVTIS